MKKRKNRISLDIPILLILTVTVCILKSIAAVSSLDYTSGHYTSKVLISLANWITLIGGVSIFLRGIFYVRQNKPIPTFNTPATYIPMALISLALVFLGYGLLGKRAEIIENTPFGRLPSSVASIAGLCAILAFLAAVSVLIYVGLKGARDYRRAICGMLIIAFLAVYVIYLYFNTELAINAPNKITDEVAFALAAVFFLYEVRISLGREVWHAYSAFGYIAALMLAYSAIPGITLYFISGEVISNSIYESFFAFTLFIFIVARLIVLHELVCEEDTAYVKALAEAYRKRIKASPEEQLGEEAVEAVDIPTADDGEQLMIDAVTMRTEDMPETDDEERTDI